MNTNTIEAIIHVSEALRNDDGLDMTISEIGDTIMAAIAGTVFDTRMRAIETISDSLAVAGYDEDAVMDLLAELAPDLNVEV